MKKISLFVGLIVFAVLISGCSTITGTVTGAGTGLVDAPAQTYRANRDTFDELPILHGVNALVMGPVGAVTGPVMGFGKGMALDIQWMIGQQSLSEVYGTYEAQSIWRPYTVRWEKTGPKESSATN